MGEDDNPLRKNVLYNQASKNSHRQKSKTWTHNKFHYIGKQVTMAKSQQGRRITEGDLHKSPILELLDAEYEINALYIYIFFKKIVTAAAYNIWTIHFLKMETVIT